MAVLFNSCSASKTMGENTSVYNFVYKIYKNIEIYRVYIELYRVCV